MNAIPLYKKHNVSCSAITQYIFFSKNKLENIKKCIINSEDMLIIFFQAELFKYSTFSIYIMDDMILLF